MTLYEELQWRGFVNQTTYADPKAIDDHSLTFYFGVDPSADSMTIGNLAAAMMVRHFMAHGHKAILLVGGATGLIGDPDGKKQERELLTPEQIDHNKAALAGQYKQFFDGQDFEIVDNYDWFNGLGYLEFLRDIGKHVPMRQMLGREFVQSRLQEDGAGISYAEFSYSLIQAYDFLHLHREKGVTLQLAGADQWGNSIAGVDLIRRLTGNETHVWTIPLVINKVTGAKFGKSESGAIWLDPAQTSPTSFYQFWMNIDDEGVEDYLKIYTLLDKAQITDVMADQSAHPHERPAQTKLAQEVTKLVHGDDMLAIAESVTQALTGKRVVGGLPEAALITMRSEIPSAIAAADGDIVTILVETGLAASNTEARRLLQENAVAINGQKMQRERLEANDFQNGRLLVRRGKAYKDSALVELAK